MFLVVRQIHRYYSAVRLLWNVPARCAAISLFGSVSILVGSRGSRGLPVLVHVVSRRAGVLRLRRASGPHATYAIRRVAFPVGDGVGVSDQITFRSSIARPTDAPVYASTATSRRQPQDSGSGWSRFSFPVGLFHPLQHAGLTRRTPGCDSKCICSLNSLSSLLGFTPIAGPFLAREGANQLLWKN